MRWTVTLSGEHVEGDECRDRFHALVDEFGDKLRSNGFLTDWKSAYHSGPSVSFVAAPDVEEGLPKLDEEWEMAVEPSDEGEVEPGPGEVLASVLSVDFASSSASELADKLDLTDADFEPWSPSGKTGFTVGDVRVIAAAKDAE